MAKLSFLTGPRAGEGLEIRSEQTIGRGEVDIVIEDPKLSRRHALVRPAEGGIEIEDLGSLNGTFVGGERIGEPRLVHGGEHVKLGDTTIEVARVAAGQPTVFASPPDADATVLEPAAPQPPPTEPEPVAEPAPPPRAPAAAPVGRFGDPPGRTPAPADVAGYRPAASLLWGPTVLCLAIIIAVAVAEVVYFAAR